MRMIAGLDEPTAGRVRVNGRDYRAAPAPMAELGILLEAKAMHTGRSARNHLLALAQTNGVSRRRVDELIDMAGCCRPRCLHMVWRRLMPAFRRAGDDGAWVVRVRGCWCCSC